MQGAHVVQPVGELHQQHADIAADGQNQLAEVFGLLGAVRLQFESRQLGDAVNQAGDLLAEASLDLLQLVRRVLDDVMQQGGGDRRHIKPVAGQNICYGNRMRKIRIAVFAPLGAVRFLSQCVGSIDQAGISLRIIFVDLAGQRAGPDYLRTRRLGQFGEGTLR